VAGFDLVRNYRENYGLHASSGILYNHESPRRGFEFVTQKVVSHAAKIKLGHCKELHLGNLDAERDWGYAKDFVLAMWLMLQQEKPGDFVIATGRTHTVRELVDKAFAHVGLDYRDFVKADSRFFREGDAHLLRGDASLARTRLGWEPGCDFNHLVAMMVDAALERESKARHEPVPAVR
jgi:GDPmannose 4,6-dehydratase